MTLYVATGIYIIASFAAAVWCFSVGAVSAGTITALAAG